MLQNKATFESGKHVVAVSGGRDSMALLHMLEVYDIVVAHINHKMRPESDLEESYLKEYCDTRNIPIETVILPKPPKEVNFQAYAREFRYAFFKQVLEQYQAKDIVLAHHGDDLVETMLMSLIRGTSIKGLVSMQFENMVDDVLYLRPLIHTTSNQIQEYVKVHNIPFFEDSSNQKDTYTRNRFRHHILPLLKEEQPQLVDKFYTLSKQMNDVYLWIKEQASSINTNPLDLSVFQVQPTFVQDEIIVQILKENHINPHQELLNKIKECIQSTAPNAKMQLSEQLWLIKNYTKASVCVMDTPEVIYLELFEEGLHKIDTSKSILISRINADSSDFSFELCYNNFDFPVIIRTRKPGDKITLPSGTKKIKDLFIDLKIPLQDRNHILMVEHQNKIVWIPELKIKSKQQPDTNKLYLSWLGGEYNA